MRNITANFCIGITSVAVIQCPDLSGGKLPSVYNSTSQSFLTGRSSKQKFSGVSHHIHWEKWMLTQLSLLSPLLDNPGQPRGWCHLWWAVPSASIKTAPHRHRPTSSGQPSLRHSSRVIIQRVNTTTRTNSYRIICIHVWSQVGVFYVSVTSSSPHTAF